MSGSNNTASHLSNGPVKLGWIREDSRKELLRLLDKCPGSKALVWDPELTEQFGLVAEYSLLKEYEVDRMFPLRPTRLPKSNVQHIVFMCRPVAALMEHVAINIKEEEKGDGFGRREYHIFFVPWKSFLCTQKLEELGVFGSLSNVEEYRLEVIALDSDILSMENHRSFADLHIDGDGTSVYLAAKAITTIQQQFGVIPLLYGKGNHARTVCGLVQKMWAESNESGEEEPSLIDRLVVIDRSVDLITPLVTQLTYEGLIDEAYGIKNITASFPPENFSQTSKSDDLTTEKKKVLLSSKDELFQTLRDCNFNAVGPTLKKHAKLISEKYESRHSAKTVGEMKQFVSHLPQMQQSKNSLSIHTSIAELIKEFTDGSEFLETLSTEQEFLNGMATDKINPFIEECIFRQRPITQVFRLLCLQTLTNNGLKQKVFEYYKREILQTYGYKHLISLHRLEKCGLIHTGNGVWNYNTIRKSLRLIVEDVNEKEPQDIAYVHSGYAPLSIRLIQILSHPGWRSIDEVLKILPGHTVNGVQQVKPKKKWRGSLSGDSNSSSTVTLVYFIGGMTYAEMSALRYLSSLKNGFEYVAATTNLINGTSLIETLIEE